MKIGKLSCLIIYNNLPHIDCAFRTQKVQIEFNKLALNVLYFDRKIRVS